MEEVRVNDVTCPNFLVLSPTRLLAQVPTQEATGTIASVKVFSSHLAVGDHTVLEFKLGDAPRRVSGLLRLMQSYTKLLLTTPGSDIFAKEMGGGLLARVSRGGTADDGRGLIEDVAIAVSITTRQMIALQSRDLRLAPDERLLSAKILSSVFHRADLSLLTRIDLVSHAGQSGTMGLTL